MSQKIKLKKTKETLLMFICPTRKTARDVWYDAGGDCRFVYWRY